MELKWISTPPGGVGDKTSLALGPMVAACGVKMAKMSDGAWGIQEGLWINLNRIEVDPTVF